MRGLERRASAIATDDRDDLDRDDNRDRRGARPASAQVAFGGWSPYAFGYGSGGYYPSFYNTGFYNTGFYNTGFYNTPFVNTYYGNTLGYGGFGYGGYGGYGSGYGGFGYGGYGGYGLGYGGYGLGAIAFGGITPYDAVVMRQEQAMLTMGRYNYMNAQSTQAYSAAQLYQQQAISTALSNYKTVAEMRDRYSPTKVKPSSAVTVVDPRAGKVVSREQLISPDGRVLWPNSTPKADSLDASKAAFEDAAHNVMLEFNDQGRARVQDVADAKARLLAYAQSALKIARSSANQKNSTQFWAFLYDVEQILDGMADPDGTAKTKANSK